MDLVQPHPKPPTPPTNVDYIFVTVRIMAYIMKGGENMNGGLSKSKKTGTLDFGGNSPLVDLIHKNVLHWRDSAIVLILSRFL